jgi:hypothetical protein
MSNTGDPTGSIGLTIKSGMDEKVPSATELWWSVVSRIEFLDLFWVSTETSMTKSFGSKPLLFAVR